MINILHFSFLFCIFSYNLSTCSGRVRFIVFHHFVSELLDLDIIEELLLEDGLLMGIKLTHDALNQAELNRHFQHIVHF